MHLGKGCELLRQGLVYGCGEISEIQVEHSADSFCIQNLVPSPDIISSLHGSRPIATLLIVALRMPLKESTCTMRSQCGVHLIGSMPTWAL